MRLLFILSICCLGFAIHAISQDKQPETLFSEGIYQEEVNGELDKAIKTYKTILDQYPDNRKVSAEAV